MSLLAYIQGKRKGKIAHDIERQAMQDPFLADALDGFESVEGNHVERIAGMRGRISVQTRRSNRKITYLGIAASLFLCVGIGGYFLMKTSDRSLIAQSESFVDEEQLPEAAVLEMEERAANEITEESNEQTPRERIADERREVAPPPPSLPVPVIEEDVAVEDAAELVSSEDDFVAVADAKDESEEAMTNTERQTFEQRSSAGARPGVMNSMTTSGKPEPKIGMRAYRKYLKDSMVRPKTGDCARKKGDVILEFKINTDGRPYNIEYRKKLCEELDKEAVRLVENGPVWVGDTTKSVILEVKF